MKSRLEWKAVALCLMLSLVASAASAGDLIVTGIAGLPRANGVSLLMHDRLHERPEAIELETNRVSSLSVLYGDSISLQIGPSSKLRVSPATDQHGEQIELLHGELRTVTRREHAKKRPEIRTPSAVIRPSTSTLHFFVDSVSGDTEVTSLESRAWVVSSNPAYKQSSILNSGQTITVRMGSAPGTIQKFVPDPKGDITGFLTGKKLRKAALHHDMTREGVIALNEIAQSDVPDTSLPSVASPFPTPRGLGWLDRMGPREHKCVGPTMCQDLPKIPQLLPAGPPACTGIPGEQCQR